MQNKLRSIIVAATILVPAVAWTFSAPPVVQDAVGLRVTDAGLNFVESQLANRDLHVGPQLIAQLDLLCYDEVGIDQATIDMLLESAELDFREGPTNGSVEVILNIPEIDIGGVLYGNDSDTFDLCPSFITAINEFRITGVQFSADISPWVDENYELQIDFVQFPTVYFDDIVIDLADFSDTIEDLIFSAEFVQDFIIDKINEMLQEKLPPMLRDTAMQAVFEGEAGGFEYFIGVGDISIDGGGGNVALDVGLSSTLPTAECIDTVQGAQFQPHGPMGLGTHNDLSMLEVSVSDAILNEALYVAWRIGTLCFDDQHNKLAAFEALFEGLDAQPGEQLTYNVAVKKPPHVEFKPNGAVSVGFEQFTMTAYSSLSGGDPQLLFGLDADFSADAILTMDPDTNQILLSIDALNAEFSRLESDVLYSDSPNAEENLKQFITGYVLPRMQNEFTDLPVSNSIIYAFDYVLLFDFLEIIDGHAVAGMSMYEADGPFVDKEPPETFFTYEPAPVVHSTQTTINFDGTDTGGGGGTLVFAHKLDDAAWSPWKKEKFAELTALTEGAHTVQVKARDRFLNEDPSPAVVNFTVQAVGADGGSLPGQGCACNMTSPERHATQSAVILGIALLLALGLMRRRGAQ